MLVMDIVLRIGVERGLGLGSELGLGLGLGLGSGLKELWLRLGLEESG